jgi:hypothetical protein
MSFLTQLTSHIQDLVKGDRHAHPVRDWFLLLASASVLVGISAGWNAWSYYQLSTRTVEPVTTTAPPAFTVPAVDAVEQEFSTRASEADRYRTTYHFVDPSL